MAKIVTIGKVFNRFVGAMINHIQNKMITWLDYET